jgi:hypothetical protein
MTDSHTTISEPITGQTPPAQADAVLVLGMHRSGTSALARVLNLMGVELGSDLLPAAADNEAGFWEHRQIQFIHDRIYESLHLDWTNVSPLPVDWWKQPEIETYRQQLREVLKGDFGSHALWGVKDPRICAMMPLWRPLLEELNVRPRCVLICRNPFEVAASLAKRDGLSTERVFLLWMRSIIDAERGTRGLPRSVTTFERLLADWRGEISRIERSLGLHFPNDVDAVAEGVSQFIRPSLRHHQMTDAQLLVQQEIPAEVRRLYAAVLQATESGEMNDLSQTVDIVAAELDKAHPLLSRFIQRLEQEHRNTVIEKNRQQIRLDAEISQHHQATLTALADADAKAAHIAGLDRQLQDQHAANQQEREQAANQYAALVAEKQSLAEQISSLQAELENILARLHASEAASADLLKNNAALQQSLTDHANWLNADRDTLKSVRQELSQYQIQRMILLRSLKQMRETRAWRVGALLHARRQVLTVEQLLPVSTTEKIGDRRWKCDGVAEFALPCLPMQGRIRIELKMHASVSGRARLYFDAGNLFNPYEVLDLGPVEGEVSLEREVELPGIVHCFRLDPLDRTGEFSISHFRIVCI